MMTGFISVVWALFFQSEVSSLDWKLKARSEYYKMTGALNLDDKIIIVYIPESVMADNRYPEVTPRNYLSKLVQAVAANEPKIIALDYHFDQEAHKPEDDHELLNTFRDLQTNSLKIIIGFRNFTALNRTSPGVTSILKQYIHASYSAGFLNVLTDQNGIVRYLNLQKDGIPSFAHEVVACFYGLVPVGKTTEAESKSSWINYVSSYTTAKLERKYGEYIYTKPLLLNYYTDRLDALFSAFSSEDLLYGDDKMREFIAGNIRDKIVLIGAGGYTHDMHDTPLAKNVQGVLIQATILRNFLNHEIIRPASLWIVCSFTLLAGLLALSISFYFRIIVINLLIVVIVLLFHGFTFIIFVSKGLILPTLPITITIFCTTLVMIFIRVLYTEEIEETEYNDILKYVSITELKKLFSSNST